MVGTDLVDGLGDGPVSADYSYVLFGWDTQLASMLAALTSREIAFSNLIQAIRSKAANGQLPKFSAGGAKSQGRSEPPLGAKILLEVYEKFGRLDKWAIELLFDDLADLIVHKSSILYRTI